MNSFSDILDIYSPRGPMDLIKTVSLNSFPVYVSSLSRIGTSSTRYALKAAHSIHQAHTSITLLATLCARSASRGSSRATP